MRSCVGLWPGSHTRDPTLLVRCKGHEFVTSILFLPVAFLKFQTEKRGYKLDPSLRLEVPNEQPVVLRTDCVTVESCTRYIHRLFQHLNTTTWTCRGYLHCLVDATVCHVFVNNSADFWQDAQLWLHCAKGQRQGLPGFPRDILSAKGFIRRPSIKLYCVSSYLPALEFKLSLKDNKFCSYKYYRCLFHSFHLCGKC